MMSERDGSIGATASASSPVGTHVQFECVFKALFTLGSMLTGMELPLAEIMVGCMLSNDFEEARVPLWLLARSCDLQLWLRWSCRRW